MANISFTRDEVILTLDVLFFSGDDRLTKNSQSVKSLCQVLQSLPIHPIEKRPENFRNPVGVSDQIRTFRGQVEGTKRSSWGVGRAFHAVYQEYIDRLEELHAIAQAIRKNQLFFQNCYFGQLEESEGFPEGALLSHLHRIIEARDGAKLPNADRCSVCHLSVERIYQGNSVTIEHHLLEPLTELDASVHYSSEDFIDVCPNCHAALHHYRPWLQLEEVERILR